MKRTQAMPALEGRRLENRSVRKDREARGIGQLAWLKRLARMLRANPSLGQALVSLPSHFGKPNTPGEKKRGHLNLTLILAHAPQLNCRGS
jgi:hypothetical protein